MFVLQNENDHYFPSSAFKGISPVVYPAQTLGGEGVLGLVVRQSCQGDISQAS